LLIIDIQRIPMELPLLVTLGLMVTACAICLEIFGSGQALLAAALAVSVTAAAGGTSPILSRFRASIARTTSPTSSGSGFVVESGSSTG
jgi:hypothetical protein